MWRAISGRAAALIVAAGFLAVGTTVAAAAVPTGGGAAPPGLETFQLTPGGLVSFATYTDMATCDAQYHTNCFKFADGTVVGEMNLLGGVNELAAEILGAPLLGDLIGVLDPTLSIPSCVTIPQMGSSDLVVEVSNDSKVRMALSDGSCADLEAALEAFTPGVIDDIILPGNDIQISPLDPPSAADMASHHGSNAECAGPEPEDCFSDPPPPVCKPGEDCSASRPIENFR